MDACAIFFISESCMKLGITPLSNHVQEKAIAPHYPLIVCFLKNLYCDVSDGFASQLSEPLFLFFINCFSHIPTNQSNIRVKPKATEEAIIPKCFPQNFRDFHLRFSSSLICFGVFFSPVTYFFMSSFSLSVGS